MSGLPKSQVIRRCPKVWWGGPLVSPVILPSSSSSGFSSQRPAQSRLVILFSIRRRRGNLFRWVVLLKQRRALITAHSTFLSRCCRASFKVWRSSGTSVSRKASSFVRFFSISSRRIRGRERSSVSFLRIREATCSMVSSSCHSCVGS